MPPTLQQLRAAPSLARRPQYRLALLIAAGRSRAQVRNPRIWQTLIDHGLLTEDRSLTTSGNLALTQK